MTELATTRTRLAELLEGHRSQSARIALVPTMGALHAGHVALIEKARNHGDVVVTSIFVNPLQFTEQGDFTNYPRTLEADLATAEKAGVDVCFAPTDDEMYPRGHQEVTVDPGPLATILEGASRPGHFRGVATVVTKLFAMVAPDVAVFGEKDYQQLTVIRRVVEDLALAVRIVACPTVREHDGLALSSRNRLLSPDARRAAGVLHRALVAGRALIGAGERDARVVEQAMFAVVGAEPFAMLDYAVVRDSLTLDERAVGDESVRLLIAASFGSVRLIDNLAAAP